VDNRVSSEKFIVVSKTNKKNHGIRFNYIFPFETGMFGYPANLTSQINPTLVYLGILLCMIYKMQE
jgi:hypothetical protein